MLRLSSLIVTLLLTCSTGFAAPPTTAPAEARTLFVSPQGDDANDGSRQKPWKTFQHAADQARAGDTVYLFSGVYHERVKLKHSGEPGRPITFAAYAGHVPIIDGADPTPHSHRALLDTQKQHHLRITGLWFRNSMHHEDIGVHLRQSQHVRFDHCLVMQTEGSSIKVSGCKFAEIDHNEFTLACQPGGEETVTVNGCEDTVVHHNHVHHTGHEGIDVKAGGTRIRIHDNHVHHVERQGLYADAWHAPVHDVHFYNNRVHDCMFGIAACAEDGGKLYDIHFYNNLVYNNRGPGLVVADWGSAGKSHEVRDLYFVNNTVVNNGNGGRNELWGGGMYFEHAGAKNLVVRNNILSGNPQGQIKIQNGKKPQSWVIENNLIDGPTDVDLETNVVGAPHFVDPARDDYRLREGSPAIDKGTQDNAPATDADGRARPVGAGVDIGAYERAKP